MTQRRRGAVESGRVVAKHARAGAAARRKNGRAMLATKIYFWLMLQCPLDTINNSRLFHQAPPPSELRVVSG